jgi:KaiC/GvpD/RAD55 family RecA-like ATPase
MAFVKATKKQSRGRIALIGPSGSGKTYTALKVACVMGKRVAVLDTERGSASKYSDEFNFDVMEMESFAPAAFVSGIHDAEKAGYDVLVIDSLSHAWIGKGGALEMVDHAAARSSSKNSFSAWREVTPEHNALVDAILRSRLHVIVTMRVKTEWVLQENERGKKEPKKLGLAPVQRDGLEYEFDVVGDMDEAVLSISKTRCKALHKAVIKQPGKDLGETLLNWLTEGEAAEEKRPSPPPVASVVSEPAPSTSVGETPAGAAVTRTGDVVADYSQRLRSAATTAEMNRVLVEAKAAGVKVGSPEWETLFGLFKDLNKARSAA